jgi:hypothetical protein
MSGRSLEQILDELRNLLNREVALGFADLRQLESSAVRCLSQIGLPALLRQGLIKSRVKQAIERHLNAQAKWPAITDCDKLDRAFAELEQKGILCRQDFRACLADGHACMNIQMEEEFKEGRSIRGYVFFHEQDAEDVLNHGLLFLAFGPAPIPEGVLDVGTESRADESSRSSEIREATLAVAREVVAVLKRHGLNAQWNGLPHERIRVPMVWRRRGPITPKDNGAGNQAQEYPGNDDTGQHDQEKNHANQMNLAAAMLRATGPVDVIDGLIGEVLLKEEEPEKDDAKSEATTEQPTEQKGRDMGAFIDRQVAAGFATPDEIADGAVTVFSDDLSSQTLRPIAEELVKRAVETHLKEQATWPAVTDCDRLDSAFAELERHGIFCRQNYGAKDGHAELQDETQRAFEKGRVIRGYCFFDVQDTDKAIESGALFLAFGPGPVADEEILPTTKESIRDGSYEHEGTAAAREIVATLQHHGLDAQWGGTVGEGIQIKMDWRRRRKPQTPAE